MMDFYGRVGFSIWNASILGNYQLVPCSAQTYWIIEYVLSNIHMFGVNGIDFDVMNSPVLDIMNHSFHESEIDKLVCHCRWFSDFITCSQNLLASLTLVNISNDAKIWIYVVCRQSIQSFTQYPSLSSCLNIKYSLLRKRDKEGELDIRIGHRLNILSLELHMCIHRHLLKLEKHDDA